MKGGSTRKSNDLVSASLLIGLLHPRSYVQFSLFGTVQPHRILMAANAEERLTRIAIVSKDKCKPKRCRQECKKSCPVVRMGMP